MNGWFGCPSCLLNFNSIYDLRVHIQFMSSSQKQQHHINDLLRIPAYRDMIADENK